jgi:hypothetical protein
LGVGIAAQFPGHGQLYRFVSVSFNEQHRLAESANEAHDKIRIFRRKCFSGDRHCERNFRNNFADFQQHRITFVFERVAFAGTEGNGVDLAAFERTDTQLSAAGGEQFVIFVSDETAPFQGFEHGQLRKAAGARDADGFAS